MSICIVKYMSHKTYQHILTMYMDMSIKIFKNSLNLFPVALTSTKYRINKKVENHKKISLLLFFYYIFQLKQKGKR